MNRYTVTLFCTRNQWYYEATVEASDFDEARKIAYRDYADKTTKIKGIHRD